MFWGFWRKGPACWENGLEVLLSQFCGDFSVMSRKEKTSDLWWACSWWDPKWLWLERKHTLTRTVSQCTKVTCSESQHTASCSQQHSQEFLNNRGFLVSLSHPLLQPPLLPVALSLMLFSHWSMWNSAPSHPHMIQFPLPHASSHLVLLKSCPHFSLSFLCVSSLPFFPLPLLFHPLLASCLHPPFRKRVINTDLLDWRDVCVHAHVVRMCVSAVAPTGLWT